MDSNSVAAPQIDPIYAAIAEHQNGHRDHRGAVEAECAFDSSTPREREMTAEQIHTWAILQKATSTAFDRLEKTSGALVKTKPTTLAGIGAVCRYMKSLLEKGTPGLPLEIEFQDIETGMAVFCDTIAAAIEGMAVAN
jgi:hypothetical protein